MKVKNNLFLIINIDMKIPLMDSDYHIFQFLYPLLEAIQSYLPLQL